MIKYIYLWFVLFVFVNPVFDNISKTFRDSIPYTGSANYKWTVWDYLTNPYLYALNQKNTVSLILTGLDGFSAASSFLIYGYPVYVAL